MQTTCHLSLLVHEQARKYGDAPALTLWWGRMENRFVEPILVAREASE